MRKIPTDLHTRWQSPDSRWDWFFLAMLVAGLLFVPFSFGVVEAWSELVVVSGAAVLAITLKLRLWLDSEFRLTTSWTILPLAAALALIVIQLMPLPASLVGLISPESLELRNAQLLDSQPAPESYATLSLYPLETRHDLRMAAVFFVVFITAATVFRTQLQIKRALWCIFVVGCAESAIALLQILTLSKKIHWLAAEGSAVVTSGSFVNYSHFCQFVNLTLGAGVALVLVRMKEDSRRDRGKASRLADLQGDRYLRPLTGIVLCVVAVFTSMSRNGVLSLLLASGICAGLLYRRGVLSVRGWMLGAIPWCVALLLFLTSFDAIYERFASLEDREAIDTRWQLTAGTLRAWLDFPIFGAGLGTHEYLFPLYDESRSANMAEHADNDWAQLFEEFGLIGAAAVLAFVLNVLWIAGKLMLHGCSSLSTAAFGLTFGLLAAAWHSLSDFGQHLPGIFMLTAFISGLIVALQRYEQLKVQATDGMMPSSAADSMKRGAGIVRAVASFLVLLGVWWMVSGALAASKAEAWADSALGFEQRLESQGWLGTDQEYVDLLVAAEQAVDAQPDNVKYGYLLNLYRWRSMSRVRDDSGNILLDEETLPLVERIVEELAGLRKVCPVYGPVYGLEGELRLQVLGDKSAAALVRHAARLTPYHAPTTLVAGRLAVLEDRQEEAKSLFATTIEIQPHLFRSVAELCLGELNSPDLAVELAADNYKRLEILAKMMHSAKQADSTYDYAAVAQELDRKAVLLLRERVDSGDATANEVYRLAEVEMQASRPEESIELIRHALKLNYGKVSWRLALSRALLKLGKPDQALREAKIVLRLQPNSTAAAQIIKQIGDTP